MKTTTNDIISLVFADGQINHHSVNHNYYDNVLDVIFQVLNSLTSNS